MSTLGHKGVSGKPRLCAIPVGVSPSAGDRMAPSSNGMLHPMQKDGVGPSGGQWVSLWPSMASDCIWGYGLEPITGYACGITASTLQVLLEAQKDHDKDKSGKGDEQKPG